MVTGFALIPLVILANPVETGAAQRLVSEAPQLHGQQCETGETLVFAGDVRDDFGLGIAVCTIGDTLTVRYSGEGDPQAVSCQIGRCAGVIDFDHYVRYRLTIITLSWSDANGRQSLSETFDAQDPAKAPVHLVTHTWTPSGQELEDAEPLKYKVLPHTKPLSLLALSAWDR